VFNRARSIALHASTPGPCSRAGYTPAGLSI